MPEEGVVIYTDDKGSIERTHEHMMLIMIRDIFDEACLYSSWCAPAPLLGFSFAVDKGLSCIYSYI